MADSHDDGDQYGDGEGGVMDVYGWSPAGLGGFGGGFCSRYHGFECHCHLLNGKRDVDSDSTYRW